METRAARLPSAAPTSSTEKVCRDSGTGVNQSGIDTWAVRPTNAPPPSNAMLRTRPPGITSARVSGLR